MAVLGLGLRLVWMSFTGPLSIIGARKSGIPREIHRVLAMGLKVFLLEKKRLIKAVSRQQ